MKKYTKDHEWIEISGDLATVGISEHAAHELGDITFVELPTPDDTLSKGDVLGVIESVKAAADVYAPIGGTVADVNLDLEEKPEIVNESPEKDGWLCKLSGIDASAADSLMDADEYQAFLNA